MQQGPPPRTWECAGSAVLFIILAPAGDVEFANLALFMDPFLFPEVVDLRRGPHMILGLVRRCLPAPHLRLRSMVFLDRRDNLFVVEVDTGLIGYSDTLGTWESVTLGSFFS